jgi:hypothetical protein
MRFSAGGLINSPSLAYGFYYYSSTPPITVPYIVAKNSRIETTKSVTIGAVVNASHLYSEYWPIRER